MIHAKILIYSSNLRDLVRCDSFEDYRMCSKLDICKHCRVRCDSFDEVFINDNDDFFDRDSNKKGVPDEVMLISFIIGLLLLIIGIYVRIQLYSTSVEEWRETVEREKQAKMDKWYGVEESQSIVERSRSVNTI